MTILAWQYHRYGGIEVLSSETVAAPRPRGGELVVRVHAASLNPKDALFRKGRFRFISGRSFPKRTGQDLAGEVVDVGPRADLPVGTKVFGALWEFRFGRGSLATHVVVRPEEIAPMPDGLGWEDAAAMPLAGLTALQTFRDLADVGPGTRVCVNGAAGGVGSFAVQIAKAMGARVTAVASARNLDLCLGLGADEAVAYDTGDPLAAGPWDVFLDAFGNRSFAAVRRVLGPRGVYVTTVPTGRILVDRVRTAFAAQRARIVVVRARRADLLELAAMWQAGKLRPLLDRVIDWGEVPEGFRHLETKRARGKIVVRV
jgi:NADPH:quinone reductase-like Zn-dependent oxidoreductase